MQNSYSRKISIMLLSMLLLSGIAAAQYGSGYSSQQHGYANVTLNETHINISEIGSGSVHFKVSIVSGNAFTTLLNVSNYNMLAHNSIYVTPSPISGVPPFNGTIRISVGSVTPGNYPILLNATSGDWGKNNTVLMLTVLAAAPAPIHNATNSTKTNTTKPANTVTTSNTPTTPTQTTKTTTNAIQNQTPVTQPTSNSSKQSGQGNQYAYSIGSYLNYIYAAVAVIIVLAVLILLNMRRPKGPKPVVQPQPQQEPANPPQAQVSYTPPPMSPPPTPAAPPPTPSSPTSPSGPRFPPPPGLLP